MAPPPHFILSNKKLATDVLSFASVAGHNGVLSEEMAHEIIARTAMAIDIFDFLRLVDSCGLEQGKEWDFNVIPKKIRKAFMKNEYEEEIANEIDDLSEDEFKALISFIISRVTELSVEFSVPIIHRVYEDEILNATLMFAYLGLALRNPPDIGPLLLGTMLAGSLLD